MTEIEERILKNQHEIMWVLHYLLGCAAPDLVGRGGQVDRMRDDILDAWKAGKALLEASASPVSSPVRCQVCGETAELKCGPSRFGDKTWACKDCWEPDSRPLRPQGE